MEPKIGTAALADSKAKHFLRKTDSVMARLIHAHPDFRPRAWLDELPPVDAFGTLVFQVLGQQLSGAATRAILSRLVENFVGWLPSPTELLSADAQMLRGSGMSGRKAATLRAIAEWFVDERLSEEALSEDERRRGRNCADQRTWRRAMDGVRIPSDRSRSARRVLPGDVALRRAVQRAYGLDHTPTERELNQLAERWRPYRSLAVAYLFTPEYDAQAS